MKNIQEVKSTTNKTAVFEEEKVLKAHEYLKKFINKFESAKRGGIHDFIEVSLFNMVTKSVDKIDNYLKDGHQRVDAADIITIVIDSYQTVIDGIRRNVDGMDEVEMR